MADFNRGKYRLTAPHIMFDQMLPAGTIVGEGTQYPLVSVVVYPDGSYTTKDYPPSLNMEALDPAAEECLRKRLALVGEIPVELMPMPDITIPSGRVPGQGPKAVNPLQGINAVLPGQGTRDPSGMVTSSPPGTPGYKPLEAVPPQIGE